MNIVILILVCVAGVMLIAWAVARSGRDNPMRGLGTERQGGGEVNMQAGNRDEVLRLLTTKQKIAAIKRYREMTGVGLREAKAAVEQMERERVMGPMPVVAGAVSAMGGNDSGLQGSGDAEVLMLEVRALLQARKKIAAIKLYRERTGASLKQAKAVIDELEAVMGYGS